MRPAVLRLLPVLFLSLFAPPAGARSFDEELGLLASRGDYAAAESLVLERLGRERGPRELWLELACLRKNSGHFAGACQAYETFLRSSPQPSVMSDLADALRLSGRLEEAERFYRDALKKEPGNAEALWGLSQVRFFQSQWRPPGSVKGALRESQELLKGLAEVQPRFALGLWKLGEVSEKLGDPDAALDAYGKALAADGNFKKAHARMARLLKGKKDYAAALVKYEKARAVDPRDETLREEARELQAEAPEALKERRERREEKWNSMKPLLETPLAVSGVTVRVGISQRLGRMRFKCAGDMDVMTPASHPVKKLESGKEYLVRFSRAAKDRDGKDSWTIEDAKGDVRVTFDQRLWIVPSDPKQTVALHAVPTGSGYFFAKEEDRSYRGCLEILPRPGEGFHLVNRVDLEAYTAGVLPAEMPSSWPLEALKVQAVVARSYVLAKLGRHNPDGFDVCDEVHCAAYHGRGSETERTNQAVNETAGLVLKAGNRVLMCVYSAQCGGRTQDYEEAWGYPVPVVGVEDFAPGENPGATFPMTPARLEKWIRGEPAAFCKAPGFKDYRNFRWAAVVPASDLEAKAPAIGRLKRVVVGRRSAAGWVTRLVLVGDRGEKEFLGDSVRGILGGVRSNLVHIEAQTGPDGNVVELTVFGGGWGHGVGLCQVGVRGQVDAGRGWKRILKHYFPKAVLKRL